MQYKLQSFTVDSNHLSNKKQEIRGILAILFRDITKTSKTIIITDTELLVLEKYLQDLTVIAILL